MTNIVHSPFKASRWPRRWQEDGCNAAGICDRVTHQPSWPSVKIEVKVRNEVLWSANSTTIRNTCSLVDWKLCFRQVIQPVDVGRRKSSTPSIARQPSHNFWTNPMERWTEGIFLKPWSRLHQGPGCCWTPEMWYIHHYGRHKHNLHWIDNDFDVLIYVFVLINHFLWIISLWFVKITNSNKDVCYDNSCFLFRTCIHFCNTLWEVIILGGLWYKNFSNFLSIVLIDFIVTIGIKQMYLQSVV